MKRVVSVLLLVAVLLAGLVSCGDVSTYSSSEVTSSTTSVLESEDGSSEQQQDPSQEQSIQEESQNSSSEIVSDISSEVPSSEVTSSENVSSEELSSSNATSSNETSSTITAVGTGIATPVNPSSIPSYNGNAYVVINNNIPNFSTSELTTFGYEKYSPLDSSGRCGAALASCGKEIMPADGEERGSISSIYPSGWKQAKYDGISGGYLWNRCHLIGWQLSAENANRQNLITGTRYMNINGMLPFENMIADYINETNNHVAFRVTPIFEKNNLVASGVQMEAYSIEDNGEGICFNVYCYNVQPGIVINYATGDSSNPNAVTSSEAVSSKEESSEASDNNTTVTMVWVPKTGKKYHSYAGCSNMKNPSQVTLDQAIEMGKTACSKCW